MELAKRLAGRRTLGLGHRSSSNQPRRETFERERAQHERRDCSGFDAARRNRLAAGLKEFKGPEFDARFGISQPGRPECHSAPLALRGSLLACPVFCASPNESIPRSTIGARLCSRGVVRAGEGRPRGIGFPGFAPFPSSQQIGFSERPGAVQGARSAAQRTLDGEDRSGTVGEEGKGAGPFGYALLFQAKADGPTWNVRGPPVPKMLPARGGGWPNAGDSRSRSGYAVLLADGGPAACSPSPRGRTSSRERITTPASPRRSGIASRPRPTRTWDGVCCGNDSREVDGRRSASPQCGHDDS